MIGKYKKYIIFKPWIDLLQLQPRKKVLNCKENIPVQMAQDFFIGGLIFGLLQPLKSAKKPLIVFSCRICINSPSVAISHWRFF